MKGFFCQLWQGQNCHDGSTHEGGINNQGGNRYLKIPGEKPKIQRHTVLYSSDDNYQDKQKGND
jgi:hypothetical protein